MKKDKELLLFPLLAGIFSIIFILTMLFPTIISSFMGGNVPGNYGIIDYILIFITYLGLAFISTFFNVCVIYTTKIRFEGGNATFWQSISFARSKIRLIFLWSVIAATVGLILRIIDNIAERSGEVGKIILNITTSLLGMMWSIITVFVVPAMVYHDLEPFDAIKKSVETLKRTWGESLIRYVGLGSIQFLFILLGIVFTFILLFVLGGLGPIGLIMAIGIAVVYFLGVILIFNVANTIFNTAFLFILTPGKFQKDTIRKPFKMRSNPKK
jgi:hypothetical protein